MIKKIWKILAGIQVALLVILFSATPAAAADLRGYDDVIIASGDVVNDDLYVVGNRIVINGVINGDLLAAGSTIIIDGTVNGDVIALGSSLTIDGTVTGSARLGGANIHIGGTIGEDLVVAGSDLDVEDAAEIGRDLVFGGSNVEVASLINGDVIGAGDVVKFFSSIGGDATVSVNNLRISSTASINGNIVYTSDNEAKIEEGAMIVGAVTHKLPEDHGWHYSDWFISPFARTWGHVFSYLMVLVVGIIIILIAPKKSSETIGKIRNKPLKTLGWGALAAFVAPIAMVIAILTIVGIPIGLIAAMLYGLMAFLAQLVVGLFIGQWIVQRFKLEETRGTLVLALFIGFTILTLVKLIPLVGWVIWWVTVLFGMGAIVLLFERNKANGKEIEVIEVPVEPTT